MIRSGYMILVYIEQIFITLLILNSLLIDIINLSKLYYFIKFL